MDTKIIAFYLPQFHETEDNNKWWGKGYTEWNAVKNAKRLYKGHAIPRVPLDDRYYDLSEENATTLKWQAELAKKYGIDGFCIYHYWFAGKRELEKPVEILRNHKEIDIEYSLSWDSATWKRTWYADKYEQEILVEQNYGDEEMWTRHFNDILPDFMDERYIKIDNKPVFHIYHAYIIPCLLEMKQCWNRLAKEHGFDGIYFVLGDVEYRQDPKMLESADAYYNFEPTHAFYEYYHKKYGFLCVAKAGIKKRINKIFHTSFLPDKRPAKGIYQIIQKLDRNAEKLTFLGTFVDYDDTPRRQLKGTVYTGNKISYFEECLAQQLQYSRKTNKAFLYINAWNEWGESAYLEPDEKNGYQYLEAVKRVKETSAR